ncbi:sensor histidine kinase [Parafrankia discariae]|uniref:sensor histidine kinase n=1 Tax=Parafrankia discariae TaxID=365528 RepID=UPI00036AEDC6|nr:ATP-binding protein [Parafrankia discariae]
MTTRARDLLNRSRALLGGSRGIAAQLRGGDLPNSPPQPGQPARAGLVSRPAAPGRRSANEPWVRPGAPAAAAGAARSPRGAPTAGIHTSAPSTRTAGAGAAEQSAHGRRAVPSPLPAASTGPAAAGAPAAEALSAICADVALRDLNLVDSLLSQLEDMEAKEEDTDRLAELYRLDHLVTRLRRNAENLRVLAGRDAGGASSDTTALVDVVRAAMSAIDHYSRVTIGRVVPLGVVGFAAEDVGRLLAELLDNATKSSPPTAPVRVGVHLTELGSALLRVEDEGIGLPPDRLRQLNERLAGDPVLDDEAVRHMGLAVVRRLAIRHDLRIWLERRHPHGTTASVLIPSALICELPESSWSGTQTVVVRDGDPTAPGPAARPAARDGQPRADLQYRAPGGAPGGKQSANGAGHPRESTLFTQAGGAPAGPTPGPAGVTLSSPPAADALIGGTTASGLPRRVSRSLKNPAGDGARPPANTAPTAITPATPVTPVTPAAADTAPAATDAGAGAEPGTAEGGSPAAQALSARAADHARLLADLDAFSEGERIAHEHQRGDSGPTSDGDSPVTGTQQ